MHVIADDFPVQFRYIVVNRIFYERPYGKDGKS